MNGCGDGLELTFSELLDGPQLLLVCSRWCLGHEMMWLRGSSVAKRSQKLKTVHGKTYLNIFVKALLFYWVLNTHLVMILREGVKFETLSLTASKCTHKVIYLFEQTINSVDNFFSKLFNG